MSARDRFLRWWQPLPLWLKVVTGSIVVPAWIGVAYCLLTGQGKSTVALLAFSAFFIGTTLHIVFDKNSRRSGARERRGFDLFSGND
jgi:hypothetical protein